MLLTISAFDNTLTFNVSVPTCNFEYLFVHAKAIITIFKAAWWSLLCITNLLDGKKAAITKLLFLADKNVCRPYTFDY